MNEWLQSHRVVDSVFLFFEFSSENPEGLDVYMHILQLLTTVDDGIQAIGKVFYREAQELLIELFCFYITTFFFLSFLLSTVSCYWKRHLEFTFWPGLPWILPIWWSTHHTSRTENCASLCLFSVVCHLCFTGWTGVSKDRRR